MIYKNQKAFTLIELSIVILILGLLVSGVLVGEALIEQAKITKTISQLREYDTAVNTFKAKYGEKAIPGDFDKAVEFGLTENTYNQWGVNGDGDGVLESAPFDEGGNGANSEGYTVSAFQHEIANFFVVLSNSGLVKNNFTQNNNINVGAPNTVENLAFPIFSVNSGIIAVTYKTKYAVNFVLAARTDTAPD
jgi:prepilin-type N-terminal cleavage/methylation domain-containing protein